ncbi:hypothetical protein WMY93_029390 [Mugilogobius chulae]|uniref:Sialate O-acetylesterase domain-containing protein n=1 Tax=Mugilogobius chulae TaxID=88201 RepID=A0AAW0MX25_9GOBI
MCALILVLVFASIGFCIQDDQNPCSDGKLRFASYYGDHMVLEQSPERAVLWGCGPLGAQVTVYLTGPNLQKTQATVSNGMWRVTLDPVKAGGPYNITAASTTSNVTLVDVLFGDVWVCGGQSNMYFEVSQIFNASEELEFASNYPDVRFFMVGLVQSEVELPDFTKVSIPWSVPNKSDLAPFSAVCWLFGRYLYKTLQYPIGLVESSWGGTVVEAWSSKRALQKCGLERDDNNVLGPSANSFLWNAMIHPMLNMTIKGAIWYQGEANAAYHRDLYSCTFPAMIRDWRTSFHEGSGGQTANDFPFGFVQLSTNQENSTDMGFPEIRWHQTANNGFVPNYMMRKTFMAVAMDLPDKSSPYGTIHPRDKQDVAYRLTLGARVIAYNEALTFSGPFPNLILSDILYVNITFDQELSVTPSKDIFEICCLDTLMKFKWVFASIEKWSETTVLISTALCPISDEVIGVRYAWRDWPCDFKACPIYGAKTSLPAPPFIFNLQSSSGWKRHDITNHYLNIAVKQKMHNDLL